MLEWTDLSAWGEAYETRANSDPIRQRVMIVAMARDDLGADYDPHNPLASPLFAGLHGLPPVLIQVGDRETVRSDSSAPTINTKGNRR
jgi:monoterpene epsilon-lactone hydrolase